MPQDELRFDGPRNERRPSRFLAPLALIAVLVVVIVIVASNGSSPSGSGTAGSGQTSSAPDLSTTTGISTLQSSSSTLGSTSSTSTTRAVTHTGTVGTYTVVSGDTFAAISAKTGVPIITIEALNPRVSSSHLTIGQVLKLK